MNFKYSLIVVVLIAVLGVFVFAQTPISNPPPIIVNAITCSETDSGLNYFSKGNITGSFWWPGANGTNLTYVGSLADSCTSNTVLLEGVCGSSINANLSNLAGALYVDCAAPNSAFGCVNGACVLLNTTGNSTWNNSTNLSLPDLRISSLTYSFAVINTTNSNNNTTNSNYTVFVNATVINSGNAIAGASTTRIGFRMLTGPFASAYTYQSVATIALNPGQSTVVSSVFNGYSGQFELNATVDSLSVVNESNEFNNAGIIANYLP